MDDVYINIFNVQAFDDTDNLNLWYDPEHQSANKGNYWNDLRHNNYRGDYMIDGPYAVVDPYPSHPPVYSPPPETPPEQPPGPPPYTPGRKPPPPP